MLTADMETNQPGEAQPLCPWLWWPSFLHCGLPQASVSGCLHTSIRRASEGGHARRTVQRGVILLQPRHQHPVKHTQLKWELGFNIRESGCWASEDK